MTLDSLIHILSLYRKELKGETPVHLFLGECPVCCHQTYEEDFKVVNRWNKIILT